MKELMSKPVWFIFVAIGVAAMILSNYKFTANPISALELDHPLGLLFWIGAASVLAGFAAIAAPIVMARRHDKFLEMKKVYDEVYKPLFNIIALGVNLEVYAESLIAKHRLRKANPILQSLRDIRFYFQKRKHDKQARLSAEVTHGDFQNEWEQLASQLKRTSATAPSKLLDLFGRAEVARFEYGHSPAGLHGNDDYVTPEELAFLSHIGARCRDLERRLGKA